MIDNELLWKQDAIEHPRVGDVWRKGKETRTVAGKGQNCIMLDVMFGRDNYVTPFMSQFRRWCAGAELVKRGEQ